MIAPFIPFFLVIQLGIKDGAWEYGPEYVFRVDVNTTANIEPRLRRERSQELICRPKGANLLSCRLFEKGVVAFKGDTIQEDVDPPPMMADNEPFEVKFNDRGIDYLITRMNARTYTLNSMKQAVEQLSIGADLNGRPDGAFESEMTTTVGNCNAQFRIFHSPLKKLARKTKKHNDYELQSLPHLNKVPGEAIAIEKTLDLDNCTYYAPSYYGGYGTGNHNMCEHIDSHLSTVNSRMLIEDDGFLSVTIREGTWKNETDVDVVEIVSVTLKTVREAETPLPVIPRPAKTYMVANSEQELIE